MTKSDLGVGRVPVTVGYEYKCSTYQFRCLYCGLWHYCDEDGGPSEPMCAKEREAKSLED